MPPAQPGRRLSPARRWAARSWSATPGPRPRASASRPGPGWPPSASCPARSAWSSSAIGLILGGLVGTAADPRWRLAGVGGAAVPLGIVILELALAIIAIGATITVIQRILHVRAQADPSTTTDRPHRPPLREQRSTMSKNGSNGSGKNGTTPSNTWAGAGRRGDGKVRVAIVGVGNCASSLVQGRYYYEDADDGRLRPGPDARRTSAATTSATSTSSPPSTSTRTRSARTSPRRSTRSRTTRTRSTRSSRPASRSSAA